MFEVASHGDVDETEYEDLVKRYRNLASAYGEQNPGEQQKIQDLLEAPNGILRNTLATAKNHKDLRRALRLIVYALEALKKNYKSIIFPIVFLEGFGNCRAGGLNEIYQTLLKILRELQEDKEGWLHLQTLASDNKAMGLSKDDFEGSPDLTIDRSLLELLHNQGLV